MIGVIDYGVGNIRAFLNIYQKLSVPVKTVREKDDFQGINKLILPGVGSFDYAMSRLEESGMRPELSRLVLEQKVPVLGICVGMQMLANTSDEGKLPGLGWIDADVIKFDPNKIPFATHLPHMGWNDVKPRSGSHLFKGMEEMAKFYFLHSYYFMSRNQDLIVAESNYGIDFTCAVSSGNIHGVQFHPEKSHQWGIKLLENFVNI